MPPLLNSRHMNTEGVEDEDGNTYLTEREPFRFNPKVPYIKHRVAAGETVFTITFRYYAEVDKDYPEHLWWAICEFQPDPILDPTIDLSVGRLLFIPTPRAMQERVLGY